MHVGKTIAERFKKYLAVLIMGSAICLQCIGAWTDSQTTDEAVHVGAGYSYWRTGDFRLNPEHPPLVKLLAAAPLLLFRNLDETFKSPAWTQPHQWIFGAELLYSTFDSAYGARFLLWLARLPMIAIWFGLGCLTYIWSRKRWGEWAGIISLAFFAFDPNWLGHGHLVTTDVAASTGFLATVFMVERYVHRPGRASAITLGGIFALSQLVKFSNIILWVLVPLLLVLAVVGQIGRVGWRHVWMGLGYCAVSFLILTSIVYRFEVGSLAADPFPQPWLLDLPNRLQPFGLEWLMHLTYVPLLAPSYWSGLMSTIAHSQIGHTAFLLGQISHQGWWYYFPVAFAVKTPTVTLLMLAVTAALGIGRLWRNHKHVRRTTSTVIFIILPPIFFLGWSLLSRINIGLRHIFPIYPFLFLWLGSLASIRLRSHQPAWTAVVTLAVIGIIATGSISWPHTIGYFNEVSGGLPSGHRIIMDSNLDWGQDAWRLKKFLTRYSGTPVSVTLTDTIPPNILFPRAALVLTSDQIAAGHQPAGMVAISIAKRFHRLRTYDWLNDYRPVARVGSSILIYDFR